MGYNPLTDFLTLLRLSAGVVSTERMPGLDYVVAAMARAGLFQLSTDQTAPTTNQQNTVWLRPSVPSWVAEGTVFLWDASQGAYALATPALWHALLSPGGYSFQSVTAAAGAVVAGTTVLAVQRASPSSTGLVLPSLGAQWISGRSLKISDWSTGVTSHTITLTTPDGATIMKQSSRQLVSTAGQLASATFTPVPDLNGWVIG